MSSCLLNKNLEEHLVSNERRSQSLDLSIFDPGEESGSCYPMLFVVEGMKEKDVGINEDRLISSKTD
jgi:hypothetical protein